MHASFTIYRSILSFFFVRTGQLELVKHTISKDGRRQVTGQKKNLEISANYPIQFGLAVAGLIAPYGSPKRSPVTGIDISNILFHSLMLVRPSRFLTATQTMMMMVQFWTY